MKRMLCCLFAAVLIVGICPINAFAKESQTIYFENGDYALIETITYETRVSGSKKGSKKYTYYNSDSIKQWEAVLTGSFTYTGSSSSCTSSSMDVTIYSSRCYLISKHAGKSENQARGSATVGIKMAGGNVGESSTELVLSCDVNGTLS